jgi:hypothetical protein
MKKKLYLNKNIYMFFGRYIQPLYRVILFGTQRCCLLPRGEKYFEVYVGKNDIVEKKCDCST